MSRVPFAVWRAAWAEVLANRRAFWFQAGLMAMNDLVWIFFWLVFFHRVGTVKGWTADDVLVMFAVLSTSAGIVLGALANVRHLGPLASTGQLDAALALPVDPLLYLLVRRVSPSNLGDLVFGPGLFLVLGHPTPTRLVLFLTASICSAVVLGAFLVLVGSLAFLSGPSPANDLGLSAVVLFSSYPIDVFARSIRPLLYVVVPAAFISSVPTRLVQDPSWMTAIVEVGVAAGMAMAARAAFGAGLRRYTSGATWTQA